MYLKRVSSTIFFEMNILNEQCKTAENKISPPKVGCDLFNGSLCIFTPDRLSDNAYDWFCVAETHVHPAVISFNFDPINGEDVLAFGFL